MNTLLRNAPNTASLPLDVRVPDLKNLLAQHGAGLTVLSLDCFDTLLWRRTEAPVDVFYDLQQTAPFSALGMSARLRMVAEGTARSLRRVSSGKTEVRLADVYRAAHPSLSPDEVERLAEAELECEQRACYAFPPVVELIREARRRGLKVVIVSDTYFRQGELWSLLRAALPPDVIAAIDRVFCSSDHGYSKSGGLFKHVLAELKVKPAQVLHLGDHRVADREAPLRLGLKAARLEQFDAGVSEALRMTTAAASLLLPNVRRDLPLASPYRGLLACAPRPETPEALLGYVGAGPILYSFARFLLEELAELTRQGKRVKPLFLMRDAYLPQKVCEAIAGEPVGHAVAISRFAAYAASFRSAADVERYLARSAGSGRYADLARQLLLPSRLAERVIQRAEQKGQKPEAFARQILKPEVLKEILAASAAYRERLFRYLRSTAGVEPGDTLVFIDLGYEGTAQRQLDPVFRDELGVDLVGRYLMAASVPGWQKTRRGLLDPEFCDDRALSTLIQYVALIEDLCSSNDRSVVDYSTDGDPVYADQLIEQAQQLRVSKIQQACLRFATDAEAFFQATGGHPSPTALRIAATGALGRLLFFPSEQEVGALEGFRLEMNLATRDTFGLFDRAAGLHGLRRRGLFFMEQNLRTLRMNYPIELRSAGLELSLALLCQQRYTLEFAQRDFSLRREELTVLIGRGDGASSLTRAEAQPTHDGFFSLIVPAGDCSFHLGIVFGEPYRWVQIESIELIRVAALYRSNESEHTHPVVSGVQSEGMAARGAGIFECQTEDAFLFIAPSRPAGDTGNYVCRVIYRPLERRPGADGAPGPGVTAP